MPYNIANALLGHELDTSAVDTNPYGLFFKPDGTKLYIAGFSNDMVYQYSLSTAWDLSTATYDSVSKDISTESATIRGVFFKTDGTKMYIVGEGTERVYQYSLTAWDLSSATYDSVSYDLDSEFGATDIDPQGIHFKTDGTKLYAVDSSLNKVYQYSLSTAWDLSTVSYDNDSFDLSDQTTFVDGIFFNSSGTKLFIIGRAESRIFQYSLTTAWDVTTATYDFVSLLLDNSILRDLFFKPDGRKLYIANTVLPGIIEYDTTSLYERPVRNVTQSLSVSWKKAFDPTIILFTIGVSTIGGNDIIAPATQIDSQWNKYQYFDETDYVQSLEWEHNLNMPKGGISQGLAAGVLDNTTGRFLPDYMGGDSELFTSILPRRPFIINAGFEQSGVDSTDPQFVGIFTRQPSVDLRGMDLRFEGADFINFLSNRYVDNTIMYTGQRSDQLIETVLSDLGYSTAQYDLDTGINTIPFAIFNKGERFSEIIHKIVEAENGQFYQAEDGILKFENRQHWDNVSDPSFDIFTSQVINAKAPNDDHIINVIEVNADIRRKQPEQTIFKLPVFTELIVPANDSITQFFQFEDPVLSLTDPTNGGETSYFAANTLLDETGTDGTSSITFTNLGTFAEAVKYQITNSSGNDLFLTQLVLSGRAAVKTESLYYRTSADASVTAYEERPLVIENPYIHEQSWAESFAKILLEDFAEPENLQEITIMAIPSLKLGDLVSWQGRNWRVFTKRTRLDASEGFVQDLTLLKRTFTSYFRIGISTIGSVDKIAP